MATPAIITDPQMDHFDGEASVSANLFPKHRN
jgi:hypothetical protein